MTVDDLKGIAMWTGKSLVTCRVLARTGEAVPKGFVRV
jgi:hypothetical protein